MAAPARSAITTGSNSSATGCSGLSIAEWLYASERTRRRAGCRSGSTRWSAAQTCADVARAIGLPPHIRLGAQARADGGADSDNILGDVMESLLGASFIERGFDADPRSASARLWAEALARHGRRSQASQERAAGMGGGQRPRDARIPAGRDARAPTMRRGSPSQVYDSRASARSTRPARARARPKTAAAQAFMERFG